MHVKPFFCFLFGVKLMFKKLARIFSSPVDVNENKFDDHKGAELKNHNEASDILDECKHICYIAKIKNHGNIVDGYTYEFWIKPWNNDAVGQRLNVRRDQIKQIHNRLQMNKTDLLNKLFDKIFRSENVYENIRKYLQIIFDTHILLTNTWLYSILDIDIQLKSICEEYINKILKEKFTIHYLNEYKQLTLKSEFDEKNEEKYVFDTVYVLQRPLKEANLVNNLVNHWYVVMHILFIYYTSCMLCAFYILGF